MEFFYFKNYGAADCTSVAIRSREEVSGRASRSV